MSEAYRYRPTQESDEQDNILKELASKETRESIKKYILSKRMGFSEQDIEDIIQDTMVKTIRSVKENGFQVDPSLGNIKTWAIHIARNIAFDLLRKKKFRDLNDPLSEAHTIPDRKPTSEDLSIIAQTTADLASKIKELPKEQQKAVELLMEGKTLAEVVETQKLNLNTAKTRRFKAIQNLLGSLGGRRNKLK